MKKTIAVWLSLCLLALGLSACSQPETTEETATSAAVPLAITFDAAYTDYDQSVVAAYEQLCTAVMNGEAEARMNVGLTEAVLQLYYTSFPLSALAAVTEKSDSSGVAITYMDQATHLQQVAAFAEKINTLKTQCYNGTVSKTVYTLNLYRYICDNYQEGSAQNVYETVMNGNGSADTYSGFFEYMLQQAGIPSYHIIGTDAVGSPVSFSAAELEGSLYFFDPVMEYYTSGGKLLRYFGMTTDDVTNFSVQELIYTNRQTAAYASDLRFDTCRKAVAWEISGASLLLTLESGKVVEIEL
ncbi:MAG: hypothetical protein IJ168_11040 [Eubacterium sp.]|nr:hypothetical protein [Eubacterium sp.]